jgi:hypothetical protein
VALRERGSVATCHAMRIVRALAHLVLALAFLSGTAAQARSVACAAMSGPPPAHHGHPPPADAVHAHGDAAERPLHERATCQALCCLVAAALPLPAPTARPAAYVDAHRSPSAADPAFGRSPAPEPGIPKRLS